MRSVSAVCAQIAFYLTGLCPSTNGHVGTEAPSELLLRGQSMHTPRDLENGVLAELDSAGQSRCSQILQMSTPLGSAKREATLSLLIMKNQYR